MLCLHLSETARIRLHVGTETHTNHNTTYPAPGGGVDCGLDVVMAKGTSDTSLVRSGQQKKNNTAQRNLQLNSAKRNKTHPLCSFGGGFFCEHAQQSANLRSVLGGHSSIL